MRNKPLNTEPGAIATALKQRIYCEQISAATSNYFLQLAHFLHEVTVQMLSAVATAPGSVSSAAASGLIAAHLSFDTVSHESRFATANENGMRVVVLVQLDLFS